MTNVINSELLSLFQFFAADCASLNIIVKRERTVKCILH